jgi:predicted transcriptional regulator
MVVACIKPSLKSALQELAVADERTLSQMVERAIREYVDRHAPKARAKADAPKPPAPAKR